MKQDWYMYKKTAAAVGTLYRKEGISLRTVGMYNDFHNGGVLYDEAIKEQESFAKKKRLKLVKRYEVVKGEQQEVATFKQIMTDAISGELKVLIAQNIMFFDGMMPPGYIAYLISKGVKIMIMSGRDQKPLINEQVLERIVPGWSNEDKEFNISLRVAHEEAAKEAQLRKMQRSRAAIRRETGAKCEGRKGWKDYPDRRAEVLKRVRQLRKLPKGGERRMAFEAIADRLNEEGLVTFTGKKWTGKGVTRFFADWNVAKVKPRTDWWV